MAIDQHFQDIQLSELRAIAQRRNAEGWRAVQTHCVNTEEGIDITYTFEREGIYENFRIRGVQKTDEVPSLQDMFLGLFPFENEAHDLFGVNMTGMVLDFQGAFYDLAMKEPMTVISPEQKAAREKAAKIAAAKAAKAKAAAAKKATEEGEGE
ncbi:NADH-quinone oxidoreductase subunit C [Denitrobacterium detoxificans]|jgi:hypothetical protein|uniref:NADH-quinone oxidoreductase subunit C n=1 Tax=Denitrobacterium detoxificans TaxID=79604 RepID=UPI0026F007C3|nr:NADH-quinone oxidoreductase subunit C [Denitrobacterium detoxificans]MBE6466134.1 NADH-quinone oxidoreductase subunit C [Denitrobacterium detoxificans]